MGSKNGMKILELEISVTKVELLLGRLNSTFEPAEESANLKTDGERLQNLKHGWEKKSGGKKRIPHTTCAKVN